MIRGRGNTMFQVYFIIFAAYAVTKIAMAIASLVLSTKVRKANAGKPESLMGLGLILLSVTFLWNVLTDSNMFQAVYSRLLGNNSALSLGSVFAILNYSRLIPRILSLMGLYFIADYCKKKYDFDIRIPVVAIPVIKYVIRMVIVKIFGGEAVIVKLPVYAAMYNIFFSLAVLVLFEVTFFRNRDKEEKFRSLYIVFLILITGNLISNGLMAVSSSYVPELIIFFADIMASGILLTLPIYTLIRSVNKE